MKINRKRLEKIILEEIDNLHSQERKLQDEETPIASIVYLLVGKALDSIHDYRGTMPDDQDVSDDFEDIHSKLAEFWTMLDSHPDLADGETPKELLKPLQEKRIEQVENIIDELTQEINEEDGDCSKEEVSDALDVVSRCVMAGKSQRPQSTETELGVMPRDVSVPPEGTKSGGVKWVKEDNSSE
tara:strand:+ start:88 stop:642 length:555 start_codon:yes stop_codon:yes gene_type:complete